MKGEKLLPLLGTWTLAHTRRDLLQGQSRLRVCLGWYSCHSLMWVSWWGSVGTETSHGTQGQNLSPCPFLVQIQPMKAGPHDSSAFWCFKQEVSGKSAQGWLACGCQVFIAKLLFRPSILAHLITEKQKSPSFGLLTCDRWCELGLDLCETGWFYLLMVYCCNLNPALCRGSCRSSPCSVLLRSSPWPSSFWNFSQVAQGGGGCSIPGQIQDQVGWDCEQPDLVENVPDHYRGVGLGNL